MKTVRIAITGLRRSGKTVFITSLVNQLLNWKHDSMPNFPWTKQNWQLHAEILPTSKAITPFPYEENLQSLKRKPPEWPKSTKWPSEIHLSFSYRNEAKKNGGFKALKLEIVDYPGEWLVDIPLLHLPFHSWSKDVIDSAKSPFREIYAHQWLRLLETVDPSEKLSDSADKLILEYRKYLQACYRSGGGYMNLQPGHFLNLPSSYSEADVVNFCPLPLPSSTEKRKLFQRNPETLFEVFEQRYKEFQKNIVYQFYKKCFKRADVQVVLLDALSILNWGLESFNDHRKCINGIVEGFKYGHLPKLFKAILPLQKIEKTLFVATKADHAAPIYHENMKNLVDDLVDKAQQLALGPSASAKVFTSYVSSIQSTEAVEIETKGEKQIYLKGVVIEKNERPFGGFKAHEVPSTFPPEKDWRGSDYLFHRFRPRHFPKKEGTPVPHINLDRLFGLILKDYL